MPYLAIWRQMLKLGEAPGTLSYALGIRAEGSRINEHHLASTALVERRDVPRVIRADDDDSAVGVVITDRAAEAIANQCAVFFILPHAV